MKIATEVGFAPPVLVKSIILTYTGTDIEKLTGMLLSCSSHMFPDHYFPVLSHVPRPLFPSPLTCSQTSPLTCSQTTISQSSCSQTTISSPLTCSQTSPLTCSHMFPDHYFQSSHMFPDHYFPVLPHVPSPLFPSPPTCSQTTNSQSSCMFPDHYFPVLPLVPRSLFPSPHVPRPLFPQSSCSQTFPVLSHVPRPIFPSPLKCYRTTSSLCTKFST